MTDNMLEIRTVSRLLCSKLPTIFLPNSEAGRNFRNEFLNSFSTTCGSHTRESTGRPRTQESYLRRDQQKLKSPVTLQDFSHR